MVATGTSSASLATASRPLSSTSTGARGAGNGAGIARTVAAPVRDGRFSAELSAVSTRGSDGAFYDTNADGSWDIVRVAATDVDARELWNAFRRDGDASVHAPELVEGRPVRPSHLPRRHRDRFAELARGYYGSRHAPELVEA